MVTFQPLPDWQDLLTIYGQTRVRGEELSLPWRTANEKCYWYSRSAFILAAIESWWRKAYENRPAIVWLPDYFCNQSLLPLRQSGADIFFYPIGENLSPDWLKCQSLLSRCRPDLFVIVHYFGIESDGKSAAQFCRQSGALLIEDAAHVLRPDGGIGRHGDFVFYSPHKVLPVPDGAILLVNPSDRTPKLDLLNCSGVADSGGDQIMWMIKRALQRLLPESFLRRRNRALPEFEFDPILQELKADGGLGILSQRILARHLPHIEQIANARKKNADELRHQIDNTLPAGGAPVDAPYRLVIQFSGPTEAKRGYDMYRAQGIPVESWPDLPPEVISGSEGHTIARKLRDSLVFLPVHQSLSPSNITRLLGGD